MTRVDLTYNPYTRERKLVIDSKEIPGNQTSNFCGAKGTELSQWCGTLWERLASHCNDDIELWFTGIQRDFEFLSDAMNRSMENKSGCSFTLMEKKICKVEDKLGELESLFAKMQEESPFPDLKTPELKRLFEKATKNDFEIAVVATMSSGKSTLINALLGQELLPARNEATTATLARIHDKDDARCFSAVCYDSEGKEVDRCENLDLKAMENLNKNERVSRIDITGNIPGIDSNSIRLVLTDTPGPNNSRTDEHEKHTLGLLKEDYKPMILYVLNGTQLETNDDSNLLKSIGQEIKLGDHQSVDRFIFVLNKADEFDTGKGEFVSKKIDDVREYLSKPGRGIINPRIFPCSSYLAKVIRMHQNGIHLSENEEDFLDTKPKRFIRDKERHFSDYASFLSPATKMQQDEKIRRAQEAGDAYQEALFYSGIPSVELAITEYLEKYALPARVSNGVHSFKDKIDKLGLEAKTIDNLKSDKKKVEQLKDELELITAKLTQGEEGRKCRSKIEGLSAAAQVEDKFEKASGSFMGEVGKALERMRKSEVSPETAKDFVAALNARIPGLCTKFEVDIQHMLKTVVMEQAKQYVQEYQSYVKDLVGQVEYNQDCDPAAILGASATLSFEEAMDLYEEQRTETVKVGEHREKNYDYKWYDGIANIFRRNKKAKYVMYDDFEDHEYTVVNFKEYINDNVMPQIDSFCDTTREIAYNYAREEEGQFKEFFARQLDQLEQEIKRTADEKLKKISSKEELERMIQENEKNKAWLDDFNKDLDNVLKISGEI